MNWPYCIPWHRMGERGDGRGLFNTLLILFTALKGAGVNSQVYPVFTCYRTRQSVLLLLFLYCTAPYDFTSLTQTRTAPTGSCMSILSATD